MTPDQINIAKAIGACTMLPGSWDKRLAQSLSAMAENKPESELTDKQIEWMFRLVYKYRKQIPVTYEKCKSNPFCSRLKSK